MTKQDKIAALIGSALAAELVVAPENPRSAESVDTAQVETLAANIAAIGLLTPLIGYRADDGTFAVTAGGRRTRAIQHLVETGAWDKAVPVPVREMLRAEAVNAGNAEQVSHADLSETDKIRMILSDAYKGTPDDYVAKVIGKSAAFVAQRRAIGDLPSEVTDALWAGTIAPQEAFGLTYFKDDPEGLAEAFEACCREGGDPYTISQLRRMFEDRCEAWSRSKPGQLVGEEAYLAAGGSFQADLFTEDKFIRDPGILDTLAKEMILESLSMLHPEAAYIEEVPAVYNDPRRVWHGLHSLTADEEEEWEDIRFNAWEHNRDEEPDWFARYDALQEKAEQHVPAAAWPFLGVIWHYAEHTTGCRSVKAGVLPEDLEPFYENGWIERPAEKAEGDPLEEDIPFEDDISDVLKRAFHVVKLHASRMKLMANPNAAIEHYLCDLARTYPSDYLSRPETSMHPDPEDGAFIYPPKWLEAAEFAELQPEDISSIKPVDQRKLLAHRMLNCLVAPSTIDAADIRAVWTPRIEILNRFKKPVLIEMLAEVGRDPAALVSLKKGALAAELAKHAVENDNWLPVGF